MKFRPTFVPLLLTLLVACRPTSSPATPGVPSDEAERERAPSGDAAHGGDADHGWETITEKDDVVVSARASARTKTPEFRGEGEVAAPLVDVLAVITDADRHKEWVYSCSESALVAQTSASTGVVYNRTDTPWPVPDRDVVLDSRVEVIDGEREVLVRFSAMEHEDRPVRDGVVRMPYLEGHYHLWAIGPQRTRVQYQVDSDSGGSLPAALVARGTRDMPLATLTSLRTQVTKTRGTYAAEIESFRQTLLAPGDEPPRP